MCGEICQIEAPRSEVFVDLPCNSVDVLLLLERENSRLTVSLQISALEKYLDFCSSLLATSLPVIGCPGFPSVPFQTDHQGPSQR